MVAPVTVPIQEEKGVQGAQEQVVPATLVGVILVVVVDHPGVMPPVLPAEVPARWQQRPRTLYREKVTIIFVLLVLKTATVNPESVSVHWPPVLAEGLPISITKGQI